MRAHSQRDDAAAAIRQLLQDRSAALRAGEAAVREAIAAAIDAFERHQRSAADEEQDGEIAAIVERLAADAAAEAERATTALDDASAEAVRLTDALRQTQEQLDAAEIGRELLAGQLAVSEMRIAELETTIVENAQLASVDATAAATDAERAAKALEAATAESRKLSAELQQVQDQLDATEIARDTLADQLAASTARIDALESAVAEHSQLAATAATAAIEDAERAAKTLDAATAESRKLSAELQQVQDQLDATEIARDTLANQLAASTARIDELESAVAEHSQLAATAATAAIEDAERAAKALDAATAESRKLSAELQQVQDQLDATEIARDTLAGQLAASTARIGELESAAAEHSQLATTAATAATADAERATKAIETANAEASRLSAALRLTQDQLDATEIARDTLADQLAASTARIETLEAALADGAHLTMALEDAQRQFATSDGARQALTEDLARSDRERQAFADDLARHAEARHAIEGQLQDSRGMVEHLPVVFRAIAASRTLADTLTAVANGLGGLFPRVALFRAKADRLEGVHQSGFDFTGDISNVVIPMTIDSVMSDAVSSDVVTVLTADDLAASNALPFGGAATSAIVLPLSIDGQTVAAVYADDGGQTVEAGAGGRAICAGLVREYAMAHVQRLATTDRSLAELNGYAGMLLDEVERLYASDVAGGHDEATLRARVLENLQTARRIYAHRVEHETPEAASFLEERIVAVARAARATPFGREVLEVAFNDGASAKKTKRRAAQAS